MAHGHFTRTFPAKPSMALKDSAKKRFVERLTGVVQSSHEKPSSKDQAYDKEVEAVRKDNPQFLVTVKREVAGRL